MYLYKIICGVLVKFLNIPEMPMPVKLLPKGNLGGSRSPTITSSGKGSLMHKKF